MNVMSYSQGLTISSGTTFSLGSAVVTLPGNWNNSGTLNAGTGTVVFNGTSGNQTITNSSGETFYNLTVNKSSGDVQLANDILINNILTLTSGDLDINSKALSLDGAATLNESSGNTCKNGTINATVSLNAPSSNNVCGMGAEITSSANLGSTTITRGHIVQTGNGNNGIERYFDITPTNNSGLNATLVFHYDDSELNLLTESELILFKSTDSGTNWTMMGGTVNTTNNTVTLVGLDGFSRWTLAASTLPLPVELISFTASVRSSSIELHWQTETEVDNYGFDVERTIQNNKNETQTWEKIGFVEGYGNSNSPKSYSFTDRNPVGGSIFNYRLKQIDTDGKFSYSDVVEVEMIPIEFILYQNYPNPFNPVTTIKYAIPFECNVKIVLYNSLGEQAAVILNKIMPAGYHSIKFDGSELSSGLYIYRIESKGFMKSKKMLLIK